MSDLKPVNSETPTKEAAPGPAGDADSRDQQAADDAAQSRRIGSFFIIAMLALGFLVLTRSLMVDSAPLRSDSALIDDSTELQPTLLHGQIESPPVDAGAAPDESGDGPVEPVPGSGVNAPNSQDENPQ